MANRAIIGQWEDVNDARGYWWRNFMLSSCERFIDTIFPQMYGTRFIFAPFHREICRALDDVVAGKCRKLIINIPPRYGKTEIVSRMFPAYGFAVNPRSKFIALSYSANLVEGNSTAVKETLRCPFFANAFEARLNDRRKNTTSEWYTVQGGGLYVSPFKGQITGFGAGATDTAADDDAGIDPAKLDEYAPTAGGKRFAGALIIDDPIKPDDAQSDRIREHVNELFETTIRNRVNSRHTPIIVIMQRLHENDLCGYLLNTEGDVRDGGEWTVISKPALTYNAAGEPEALWEHKHTVQELRRIELQSPYVFETQYGQNPTPKEGLMYTVFRTYDTLPVGRYIVKNYTDTADGGGDFCVSIDYREYEGTGNCYIVGVVCTDKGMDYTEPEVARMMDRDGVHVANIESNNGGRGFARNVERNLRLMGNTSTRVQWFTQTKNKEARIFTHSADVQNMVFYPADWKTLWPVFHNAVKGYRKAGKNAHDDAPDALTGVVEMRSVATGRKLRVGSHVDSGY